MSLAWALLASLSLMWGTSFAATAQALAYFEPLQIMGFRLALGAVTLLVIAGLYGRLKPLQSAWWQYLGVALTGNVVPFALIAWGQQEVSSSVAGAIMGSMPLIMAGLATGLGLEKLTAKRWGGLGLGLVGLWVLALSQEALDGTITGALALLAAVTCYSVSAIIARLGHDKDPLRASAYTLSTSAVIGLVIVSIYAPVTALRWDFGWVWIAFLGLLPTGLSAVFYFKVIQLRGPVFLSQVNYFVPLVAFCVGVLALGETFHIALPTALVLILGGLYLARQRVA